MLDYNQFEIIFTALALRKVLKLLKIDRIDLYEEIDDGLITISIFRSICKFSKKQATLIVFSCRCCKRFLELYC